MTCRRCGTELKEDFKVCPNCGKEIDQSVYCPQCGHENTTTAVFCADCGTVLNENIMESNTITRNQSYFIWPLVWSLIFPIVGVVLGIIRMKDTQNNISRIVLLMLAIIIGVGSIVVNIFLQNDLLEYLSSLY